MGFIVTWDGVGTESVLSPATSQYFMRSFCRYLPHTLRLSYIIGMAINQYKSTKTNIRKECRSAVSTYINLPTVQSRTNLANHPPLSVSPWLGQPTTRPDLPAAARPEPVEVASPTAAGHLASAGVAFGSRAPSGVAEWRSGLLTG